MHMAMIQLGIIWVTLTVGRPRLWTNGVIFSVRGTVCGCQEKKCPTLVGIYITLVSNAI